MTDDLLDHFPCLVICETHFKKNLADARPNIFFTETILRKYILKFNQKIMLCDWAPICHMDLNTSHNYLIS